MNISISFTREEMNEMRFILKHYMHFYPYTPNDYFHKMRGGLVDKFTDGINRWNETHPETDCTCEQCKFWHPYGDHQQTEGRCKKHAPELHIVSWNTNACNDFEWSAPGTIPTTNDHR